MKQYFFISIFTLFAFTSFSQQTITSVSGGNANNPLVWDCFCFPSFNDNVVINHDIIMNVDWIVNGGGSITISASGSFIEDAQNRAILIDGTGSVFQNNGTTELTNIAITNGAKGYNTAAFVLDSGLFIDASGEYQNTGVISSLDSLLNQGYFFNGSGATLDLGDFLNIGNMQNDGTITTDSLGNTGTLLSNGNMFANVFGNDGTWTQFGDLDVINNFYNAGTLDVDAIADIFVGGDFFNGDTLGGAADLTNNGGIAVTGDFYNSQLMDGSGRYCITGNSTNSGNATGTFDFCDQSPGGSGFDLNVGSVAPTITNCATPCAIGLEELEFLEVLIYPNPTSGIVTIEIPNSNGSLKVQQVDINGKMIQELFFDESNFVTLEILGSEGLYQLKFINESGAIRFVSIAKN